MIEREQAVEALREAYESLNDKKRRLRDLKYDVKVEIEATPGYDQLDEELQNVRGRMKTLKDNALERTGHGADIDTLKEEVDLQKEIISGILEEMIRSHGVKTGEEMEIGNYSVIPRISVKFTKQMKLL